MAGREKKFETWRTRKWRATDLQPGDERTIGQIEQYGCAIISVGRQCKDLSWSYSVGVFDTCGKPDLIVAGLDIGVAQACLNEAARRLRTGADLSQGRHAGLVGKVDCKLRHVDRKWTTHVMNRANWYYEGSDYPVLQVVYADLGNRFPEDKGFNRSFAQPMMQTGAVFTEVERNFWEPLDEQTRFAGWKFSDPPHSKVFISDSVYSGREAITYVSHDKEGGWQFLGPSMAEGGGPSVVCLHHLLEKDRTLTSISDLPKGWWAERDAPGQHWRRDPHEPDEADL